MSKAIPEIHPPDALLDRLVDGSRRVVFLVGSALTMPHALGKPGVANVDAMLELIRARIRTPKRSGINARMAAMGALQKLEAALAQAPDAGAKYRLAFDHLKGRVDGAESVNQVIREAVLQARSDGARPPLDDVAALTALEASPDGWYLGPAVKALGLILARHPKRFGGTVLTTNFDPLIEAAVRAAHGQAQAVELVGDGTAPTLDPVVTSVVHLHGLWRGDSLNTSLALTRAREALTRSLARLYDDVTLVVLGYGGWDDVLMRALAELTIDVGAKPDVLWCFYQGKTADIEAKYPDVLELLGKLGERSVCYAGVDCNDLLPKLRARLDDECEIIGRGGVCNALLDAFQAGRAVEIIGERRMKRSKLLVWLEKQAGQLGARAARFSARELGADPTPEALVRRIAVAIGCEREMLDELRRKRSVAQDDDVARALGLLAGTWILIENAEALAVGGHAFHGTFFDDLRSHVQAGSIYWVSMASTPIGELFVRKGLTSRFLNDAIRIYAGGLDRREVELALSARIGGKVHDALKQTGTLPGLVHRVCHAEWEDVDRVLAELPQWAEGICEQWWNRPAEEQALLTAVANGLAFADMTSRQRSDAAELTQRGLLVETDHGFVLNGRVWEDYVRGRQ